MKNTYYPKSQLSCMKIQKKNRKKNYNKNCKTKVKIFKKGDLVL